MLEAYGTHSFGDTGCFAVYDRPGRLWRYISRGQPCTTCCENEVELFFIAPFAQRSLDQLTFVGNDGTSADNSLWQLCEYGANVFATRIFASALCTAITDCKHSNG